MNDLTEKDKKVLDFIIQYQHDNGYSPSLEDIKTAIVTKSTRGAVMHLDKLTRLGYIERKINSRRAIKVLIIPQQNITETINVPILGNVKAGFGGIAEQTYEGYKDIPISMTGGRREVFLLRVNGDSMSRAGINPDDLILVTPQSTANSGDIVIAYDDENNEGTVKRLKKLREFMVLLPESDNPEHKPRIGVNFHIQGKVIGVFPNSQRTDDDQLQLL